MIVLDFEVLWLIQLRMFWSSSWYQPQASSCTVDFKSNQDVVHYSDSIHANIVEIGVTHQNSSYYSS